MRFLMMVLIIFTVVSCNPSEPEIKTPQRVPICGLFNITPTLMLCMEYTSNPTLSVAETDCFNQRSQYSSDGAVSYQSLGAGFIVCDTTNIVGQCTLADRKITYYSSEFTSGGAQSDCTSLGGTFQ